MSYRILAASSSDLRKGLLNSFYLITKTILSHHSFGFLAKLGLVHGRLFGRVGHCFWRLSLKRHWFVGFLRFDFIFGSLK